MVDARMTSKRSRGAGLAVVVGLVLSACGKQSPNMLDPKGSEAKTLAGMWWVTFTIACAVYGIVAGLIVWAILRGRRTEEGKQSRLNEGTFIVMGGVVVPLVILMVLAGMTVHSTSELRKPEQGALRVNVVGKRWWWAVRYPDQKIDTANEIHVPVGRPIEIGVDSDNVIHSFWVPQLGGKLDMIPGQHNVLRFTVKEAGTYRGECAEFCGIEHARMNFVVIAQTPAAFGRWLAQHQRTPSAPDTDLATRGELVFQRNACAGCHTVRGTQAVGKVGPDLTDFGSRQSIGALTLPNTEGNLAGWIANSQTIKPGNLMPPISLSPEELRALTAYLESLE
jgi:cytochrome c oxidase subunit 2